MESVFLRLVYLWNRRTSEEGKTVLRPVLPVSQFRPIGIEFTFRNLFRFQNPRTK